MAVPLRKTKNQVAGVGVLRFAIILKISRPQLSFCDSTNKTWHFYGTSNTDNMGIIPRAEDVLDVAGKAMNSIAARATYTTWYIFPIDNAATCRELR